MSFRHYFALILLFIWMTLDYRSEAYSSEIYQFVDPSGVIHFTNVPTDPRYKRRNLKAINPFRFERQIREHDIDAFIDGAAEHYEVDPALIKAMIRVESNFDPNAVSSAGAEGLMQIMPKTAEVLEIAHPFDPEENIAGGTRYIRYLLDRFAQDIKLALAAYNAGPESITKYGGVPPYAETKRYISKVLHFYEHYLAQEEVYQATNSKGDILLSNRPGQKPQTTPN